MRRVLRSEVMRRIRQRTGMTDTAGFVTDTELAVMVNESYCELYDLLVNARGHEHFRKSQDFVTVVGQSEYSFTEDDVYQVLTVLVSDGVTTEGGIAPRSVPSGNWSHVQPFMPHEMAALLNTTSSTPRDTRYRLKGLATVVDVEASETIELLPVPTTVFGVRIVYVPAPNTEEFEGDLVLNGIAGWERYMVLDVSIQLLSSEESDTSQLERELERTRARIESLANLRDAGYADRVVDVQGYADDPALFGGIPRKRGTP